VVLAGLQATAKYQMGPNPKTWGTGCLNNQWAGRLHCGQQHTGESSYGRTQ